MANDRNFDVYFEAFGRKLKIRILAENETHAKQKVLERISFVKIEKSKEEFNEAMDFLDKFIDAIDKSK